MKYRLGVLKGDFIGPEITDEAIKVLRAVEKAFSVAFDIIDLEASGTAYDKYGVVLPQETLTLGETCDALLKGPFGGPPEEINHPKWSNMEQGAILPLRKHFNLYTNLREVKIYDSLIDLSPVKPERLAGVDIVVVRELTGGMYFGEKGSTIVDGSKAYYDVELYSELEIKRIAVKAFDLASSRKRKKLTLIGKSNVMKSSVLWREVVEDVRSSYPDVEFDYMHVDNASMQLIMNPGQFDVILTSNIFGDILSDEASVLCGSIGLLPSASLGDSSFGLYEPVHGSAPGISGKNLANPISAILCLPLMFRHSFKREDIALCIEQAVKSSLDEGYRTKDLQAGNDDEDKVLGTREMGDVISDKILMAATSSGGHE